MFSIRCGRGIMKNRKAIGHQDQRNAGQPPNRRAVPQSTGIRE
jgi:hypothetical protein